VKSDTFTNFADGVAASAGRRGSTVLLVLLLVAWGIAGYLTGFPDTWWWHAGTATGLAACVMMFVVRDTQQRNTVAMHRRLDDLLRVINDAQRYAGVEPRVSPSLDEPRALPAGASSQGNAMASRQQGGRTRYLWLVPAPDSRERDELTPLRRKQHDADARLTETSTTDV